MRLKVFNSFFALCVATVAVSCSNDQVIDDLRPAGDTDSDMISFMVADDTTRGGSFGNRPGSSTRATLTTSSSIKNPNIPFAVYGDMTSIDDSSNTIALFNQEEVNYIESDDSWKYDNLRYWFPGYEYSFVAIHPATIIPKDQTSNDGLISEFDYSGSQLSFTYTLPTDYTKTTDILTATYRRRYTSGNVDDVSFRFNHILARLNFTVQVDRYASQEIVLDNLSMTGVINKGTYQISPATLESNDWTDEFYDGTWKLSTQKAKLFDKSFADLGSINPNESIQLFKAEENPLLVIPQGVNNDIVVSIVYHYGTDTENKFEAYSKLFSVANTSHNGVWKAGMSYNYTISLGGDECIIFATPEVENWKPAEGGNYIITD